MVAVEQIGDVVRVGVDDLGQVLPGAKAASGAGQQHGAAGFVLLRLVERGEDRIGHFRLQRIEPVRPVQRDLAIEGMGVDENHGSPLWLLRTIAPASGLWPLGKPMPHGTRR